MKTCKCCEKWDPRIENDFCPSCNALDPAGRKRKQTNMLRRERDRALDQARLDCGLRRVKGSQGGIYWE
jgi:hypothetical protein